MTIEELDRLEEQLSSIDAQICELIEKRWTLINPTPDEVQSTYEALTDDPYNTLCELVEPTQAVGRWLIPDEVLCQRRWEVKDADNPTR